MWNCSDHYPLVLWTQETEQWVKVEGFDRCCNQKQDCPHGQQRQLLGSRCRLVDWVEAEDEDLLSYFSDSGGCEGSEGHCEDLVVREGSGEVGQVT